MGKDLDKLNRFVSYILRHASSEYKLKVDEKGWVSIDEFLSVLHNLKNEWQSVTRLDLVNTINRSAKIRHEIEGDKIRALYGHSTTIKLNKQLAQPPEILYHGTSFKSAERILKEGLKPMSRQYVHMSVDLETAKNVGYRKSSLPCIVTISAKAANDDGVKFYIGNDNIWLADEIPHQYIQIINPQMSKRKRKELRKDVLNSGYSFSGGRECIIYKDGDRRLTIGTVSPKPNVLWVEIKYIDAWDQRQGPPTMSYPREEITDEMRLLIMERLKEYLTSSEYCYVFYY